MTWTPERIDPATWAPISAILGPCVEESGEETLVSLIDELLANTAQLWVLRKGGDPVSVAVTELVNSPGGPVVHGRYLAGHGMADWIDDLIDTIATHARVIGARGIEIKGRPGWARVLGARGWRHRATVMALEFSHGQ
jgi:hypothetical protein